MGRTKTSKGEALEKHKSNKGMAEALKKKHRQNAAISTNILTLIAQKAEFKKKHGSSIKTQQAYDNKITQAKVWLEAQCEAEETFQLPMGCPENIDLPTDWLLKEFRTALDKTPNRLSATVLALFIIVKCFMNGCGIGVAEQAHAAFKKYWDEVSVLQHLFLLLRHTNKLFIFRDSNGLYCRPWKWFPGKNIGTGNPASSKEVHDVVKAVLYPFGKEPNQKKYLSTMVQSLEQNATQSFDICLTCWQSILRCDTL